VHKKQTRILVTGASGFVGQAVCRELLRLGYTPRACLTNIAKWPALQAEVPGLSENAVIGDLTAQPDLREAFQDIDGVIHLAARVHVMRDRTVNPLAQFRRVNVQGSIDLARAAARYGVRHLVYVSSIKVNGEATSGQAFTEDDVPAPVDPYGISKREAEDALRSIAFATGLEVAIVRPPLVYGPGVRANFLRLLKLAEMGIPLPLPDTKNLRSMVHVENLSSLLVRCLEDPGAANQTFLISDGEDLSTRDLICGCWERKRN